MKQQYFLYHDVLSEWSEPEDIFKKLYSTKEHAFWLDSSLISEGSPVFPIWEKLIK